MENNNYFRWRVTLYGPQRTPYEGGIFTIRIIFPLNYASNGPEFKFLNRVYHLNVDCRDDKDFRHISMNFLNEWPTTGKVAGKPGYGVKQAFFDIFCLFYEKNIYASYDSNMEEEYKSNREKFDANAKMYTKK